MAHKSFWMHPMELLGDVGHMEPSFDPFGDSVSVGARSVHGLCQTYNGLKNRFGHNYGTPTCRGSSGCSFRSVWRLC